MAQADQTVPRNLTEGISLSLFTCATLYKKSTDSEGKPVFSGISFAIELIWTELLYIRDSVHGYYNKQLI